VLCDIVIENGVVQSVEKQDLRPRPSNMSSIDKAGDILAGGAVVFPCFVDCHTHLIKTHTVPRNRNPTGSMNDAIKCEQIDEPRWNEVGDIERRLDFALRTAFHHGTRAIRTHLDGINGSASLRQLVYAVFDRARAKWAAQGFEVQGVANLALLQYLDLPVATAHADEAGRRRELVGALSALFVW
jgi:cytosine deaminase